MTSEIPPGPSSNINHPNYRPPDVEPIPGITDRRWEGRIKMWFEDKGYGFISNEELKKRFNDLDVFLHLNQKRHFKRGDTVACICNSWPPAYFLSKYYLNIQVFCHGSPLFITSLIPSKTRRHPPSQVNGNLPNPTFSALFKSLRTW
ncbi:unnamed protein product [Effrenium voratum]|uniref:Cold shock domain-containing protein n=1 Tax=Effrenium voratum TaxID=2562239 RepID=A0AA36MH09_9DINO|nr:unnamed protein product [Effrenium voratum]